MGKITVQNETTKTPIRLIGYEAGICYGSDTSDSTKNYKRGLMNLKSGHGRTFEFPQVYLTIDGYSARFMRELYTHIAGSPTRLQASTRYIPYEGFEYIIPPAIEKNQSAKEEYIIAMSNIQEAYETLLDQGISKEDVANLLPLGMKSKMVLRTNARHLIDMSHQRLCTRAYWEYREFMKDLMEALSNYSEEWKYIVDNYFIPKCELYGYCTEHNSCGRKPKLD